MQSEFDSTCFSDKLTETMVNPIAEIAFVVLGAYLLGSFPPMLLLSRARRLHITPEEDSHITVWHTLGLLQGLSMVMVDILKGVIPVVIGFVFDFRLAVTAFATVAALTGQMWPLFQKFQGGKGNTTGVGIAITFTAFLGNGALWALGCCLICFAIGGLVRTIPKFIAKGQTLKEKLKLGGPVSNSMPLGMLSGFAALPLASWLFHQPAALTASTAAVFILIVIRRLTANLNKDLNSPKTSIGRILFTRFLFDRSYF